MSRLERVSAVVGELLVAVSSYQILTAQPTGLRVEQQSSPVEELADELKEAWADRHTP